MARNYIMGMDPYTLIDGIENTQENEILEQREYDNFLQRLNNIDAPENTEIALSDLLSIVAINHYCKGIKSGMKLSLSLNKNDCSLE